jgi:hypothetical protein
MPSECEAEFVNIQGDIYRGLWVQRCLSGLENCVNTNMGSLSLLARRLESWVRIPLKAWMSVCVYSVFV